MNRVATKKTCVRRDCPGDRDENGCGPWPVLRFIMMYGLKARRECFVFDFAVKGTVVGFNTSQDGTKTFIKVQPPAGGASMQRDERPGLLDILVPANTFKNLAVNTLVTVRGKALVMLREWRNPREGTVKTYVNYRFEAEVIEPAKA